MANSRKHKGICPACNGNGYLKILFEEGREHIIQQCTECKSEGEIYVDESEVIEFYVDDDTPSSNVSKLH